MTRGLFYGLFIFYVAVTGWHSAEPVTQVVETATVRAPRPPTPIPA